MTESQIIMLIVSLCLIGIVINLFLMMVSLSPKNEVQFCRISVAGGVITDIQGNRYYSRNEDGLTYFQPGFKLMACPTLENGMPDFGNYHDVEDTKITPDMRFEIMQALTKDLSEFTKC